MSDYVSYDEAKAGLIVHFFPAVNSQEWTKWKVEDQQTFLHELETVWEFICKMRAEFDAVLYKAHPKGELRHLEPMRAARTGDKPGRKTTVPTVDDIMAKYQ